MGTNQRAQIVMSDAEIAEFIEQSRTCTMATIGPNGTPHLVAMWYAVIDGQIWFETKSRAQKTVNLRRNPAITVSIEAGYTYDQLRGVSIEGKGVVIDDADALWKVGVNVFERYTGPYTDDMKPFVETMLNKRVAVRVDVERIRTWDHRKLGMPPMPVGGSTAEFLPGAAG
jgi:PPOX class probable F420-dependent enzyme